MEQPRLTEPDAALNRRDLAVLAAYLLFLLIFFAQTLALPGDLVLGRAEGDARNQFYGWRAYGFGQVREGHFPLWNPYEHLGEPFVATLQSAMFYPFNWLCAVMPLGRGINLSILINLLAAGVFTYLWCRRLGLRWQGGGVAMVGYVFGAPQILRIFEGHWSFLAPMAWTPAILLFVEALLAGGWRPLAIVGGALAVAMQWFGGNPQYLFYGGIAALLYLIGRLIVERARGSTFAFRAIAGFIGIYALGSLLAGAQLLPALELLQRSSRVGQLSFDWISQYPLPPENLVTLISPDFFGSDVSVRYWGRWNLWESSAYVGVVVLALAFIGLRRGRKEMRLLAGLLALFFLLLALATPLLRLLYETLPGFDLFRSPGRYLYPFSLFVALLAGMGVDALLRAAGESEAPHSLPYSPSRTHWRAVAVCAVALGLIGLFFALSTGISRDAWSAFFNGILAVGPGQRLYLPAGIVTPEYVERAGRFAGLDLLRAALLLGALAILLHQLRNGRVRLFTTMLFLLLAVDAWSFGHRYLATFDPRTDGLTPGAVSFLRETPKQPARFFRGGDFAFPSCEGMTWGVACVEGVQPNVPARFRDLFWTLQSLPPKEKNHAWQSTSYSIYRVTPPLRMLNLRYIVQYKNNPESDIAGLKRGVYEDDKIRIDELPEPFPRAWLVHNYAVMPEAEMLADTSRVAYDRQVLLEEDPHASVAPAAAAEPVPEFTLYEPDHVRLKLRASSDALLVMSDLQYPGWEATVDSRSTEILRANYALRAVAVPAGEHDVEFAYRPRSFRLGLIASGIGLAVCACFIVLAVWSRRRVHGA